QTFQADLAIIGAGGAGLRAAIAAAQANPNAKIALISKVYPMRIFCFSLLILNNCAGFYLRAFYLLKENRAAPRTTCQGIPNFLFG
ncbi:FAD-binding protein, partial [Salmonella enterica subsp. enterica serovar Montevideo]|nr:FAD-binding protein [Salmonella enterica subsp. enterica serovar Montevideo]